MTIDTCGSHLRTGSVPDVYRLLSLYFENNIKMIIVSMSQFKKTAIFAFSIPTLAGLNINFYSICICKSHTCLLYFGAVRHYDAQPYIQRGSCGPGHT